MPRTYVKPTALAPIVGIHHVTAIASDPQRNLDFYTKLLGLRFVKLTVNFDDPGTYHFYFGNETGEPGTALTFFPWPHVKRGVQGTGSVIATAFNAPKASKQWWSDRLAAANITVTPSTRFNDEVLAFEDHDGMRLEIVFHDGPAAKPFATRDIPTQHALRGFHSVTLSLENAAETAALLQGTMGFIPQGTADEKQSSRQRYIATGDNTAFARIVDIIVPTQRAPASKLGAGVVHHVAFRTPDLATHSKWQEVLAENDLHVTPVIDRNYFHSIYFREPGHVLFEFATDAPGFTADEPLDQLGTTLRLPPQYEHKRDVIVRVTPRITLPTGGTVGGIPAQ
ncbi:MAG TPA: ring-cleaving dioxygenase [Phycisphaerales bacterium]|nr:ring-cleaving dioxygenase [Phycisphaerales bacterium]HLP84755.1 ring-cleaving dioxygenase [Phycisphaerales bacterium]